MFISELREDQERTIVMSFGRMNPPTVGHQLLIDRMADIAKKVGGKAILFLSKSHDPQKNPLQFRQKVGFAQALFPSITINDDPTIKTPIDAMHWATKKGFTKMIFVVGADRIESFSQIIHTYNGKKNKEGIVPFSFPDGVEVVSGGERDPDSEGVEGMSASKAREFAASGDLVHFLKAIPGTNTVLKKQIYKAVRRGMGAKKSTNEGVIEFNREDPMDSRTAPKEGFGSMTLRGWKKSLARRLHDLAQQAETNTDPRLIDDPAFWESLQKQLGPKSIVSTIVNDIVISQNELEATRRKGGIKSRGFKRG